MALIHLNYSFEGVPGASIPEAWFHSGVVGSGDMEVLLYRRIRAAGQCGGLYSGTRL